MTSLLLRTFVRTLLRSRFGVSLIYFPILGHCINFCVGLRLQAWIGQDTGPLMTSLIKFKHVCYVSFNDSVQGKPLMTLSYVVFRTENGHAHVIMIDVQES